MKHLFGLGFFFLSQDGRLLGVNSLNLSLTGSLSLCTLGIHLLLQDPLSCLLGLGTVNMFDECSLVLECVTLAEVVQLVIEVLVNLPASTVLHEKTTKNTKSSHPQNLAWHTSICGTLPLTETTMSTDTSSSLEFAGAGSRVHGYWLSDDKAISNEFANGLA